MEVSIAVKNPYLSSNSYRSYMINSHKSKKQIHRSFLLNDFFTHGHFFDLGGFLLSQKRPGPPLRWFHGMS